MKIKKPTAVKDDTHQAFHFNNRGDGETCFLSIKLACFHESTAVPRDIPSKTKQGTTPAVLPEVDIFACVVLEIRSKASLQACKL